MKAYKGFNKDMTCRGFQFKEGETYTEDNAELCKSGFHACELPLDVFGYYAPGTSVYHEVELNGVCKKHDDDTKVCAKQIKVGAGIDIKGLITAQFEYVKAHCTEEHTDSKLANAGDRGAANAGYYGAANAGYCGAANAGDCGAANAGDCGAAISRGTAEVGNGGVAVARGNADYGNKVRGKMGAILIIAQEHENSFEIESWVAGVVDGVNLKPDVWYKLENGEFVEAE